jgi:transposase
MKNNQKVIKVQLNKHDRLALLEQENALLKAKVNWYEEQVRLHNQKRFGASSEKTDPNQLDFFNEAEKEYSPKAKEPTEEEITYKRKKRKKKSYDESYGHLPTETIVYDLSDDEKKCLECDHDLHEMTKEIRKEIKIIPAQAYIVEHVKKVYSCRHCESTGIFVPIKKAEGKNPILKGSLASPSIVAYVMDKKYTSAMPLYRQEKEFKNFGVNLSRQTLSNWIIKSSDQWLSPIYKRLHELLTERKYLHADETTLQVLKEDGRSAHQNSYMWLYATSEGTGPPIYLYDYQTTRASKHPKKFLQNFEGYLQTDGYSGYSDSKNISVLGCFAHARRKFVDALKAVPDEASITHLSAKKGLNFCNQLYSIEKKLVDLTPKERYEVRNEESKKILDNFHKWLQEAKSQALPKSSFGTAIGYSLKQWFKLIKFIEDGNLSIDNNKAERAIRPFVVGRKNFLFSNTPKGATASARIYSIIETAKGNNVSPYYYLKYLFETLPNIDLDDQDSLDQLLPWSKNLPKECYLNIN